MIKALNCYQVWVLYTTFCLHLLYEKSGQIPDPEVIVEVLAVKMTDPSCVDCAWVLLEDGLMPSTV